jgi:hypothetical protein
MNLEKQGNRDRSGRHDFRGQQLWDWLVRREERFPRLLVSAGDYFQRCGLLAVVVLTIFAGGLTGLTLVSVASLTSFATEVDALADYRPPQVTKVYASNGKVIGELSLERRIPIEYSQIPEQLRHAILAIEDTRFYDHLGIDPVRIIGSMVQNLIRQRRAQGASTLTQQLARTLFLNREKTYIRKIKEAMFALPDRARLHQGTDSDDVLQSELSWRWRLWFRGGGQLLFQEAAEGSCAPSVCASRRASKGPTAVFAAAAAQSGAGTAQSRPPGHGRCRIHHRRSVGRSACAAARSRSGRSARQE